MLKAYQYNYWQAPWRVTSCKRWCQRSWLAHRTMHRGLESANMPDYICCMNDDFMRSLQDRYEVIYDWPSPTAMISKQLQQQQQWLPMGMACKVVHKKLGKLEWEHAWMNGEYDRLLKCSQVRYSDAMAMAMMKMSTERKPPWMPPS